MNRELKKIFDKDQRDRGDDVNWDNREIYRSIREKDRERRKSVDLLIKKGRLKTGKDYAYAAMIFQHGEKPAHYLKANKLAKIGSRLGDKLATWLVAATTDRYLLSIGKKFQKYGTQYIKNKKTGKWELQPVDPRTTNEERRELNVLPIIQLKKKRKEFKSSYNG